MGWSDPPTCKACETECNCYVCISDTSCRSDCTRNNCGFCRECRFSIPTLSHDDDELKIVVHDLFIESKKQKELINKLLDKIEMIVFENSDIRKRLNTLEIACKSKLNPNAKPFIAKK